MNATRIASNGTIRKVGAVLLALLAYGSTATIAAACDASCEAARKAANPLADIKAIMTDNTLAFRTGTTNEDSYTFGIQPVYALPLTEANLVLRGIIPIMGIQPGASLPPAIGAPSANPSFEWGLGDTTLQAFYSPVVEGDISFGFGAQVSLPTRTRASLTGAGWGGGPAGVIFGQTGDLSWGAVVAHMWGGSNFSTSILQPILTYGLGQGWYVGYNNVVSYNWSATGGQAWTVPLGLMAGRTIVTNEEKGTAVDISIGYYALGTSPQGGPDQQLKVGLNFFF